MDFLPQWLRRFRLTPSNWREEIAQHADELPFIPPLKSTPLFEFLFGEVPGIVAASGDPETVLLAEAYGWCCFMFWQCESSFPALPENYALQLKTALTAYPAQRDPSAVLLARMAVEFNAEGGRCGFNKLQLDHPEVIRESETLNHEGRYDLYLKAQEKYEEYVYYLEESPQFTEEWEAIKAVFPNCCAGRGIIRRSVIPERNWVQGPGAEFETEPLRFQAIFDFFCWKYFLWGMENDKPLLLKTSVVVTPHGTQIFIPGYISFDPRRDLNFPAINRLHKARGVSRQGPGFSIGRKYLADLKRRVVAADEEARSKGLKGTVRYTYICDKTGHKDYGDFRRLRTLLAAGKAEAAKKKAKGKP